jgi:hypothetical protein
MQQQRYRQNGRQCFFFFCNLTLENLLKNRVPLDPTFSFFFLSNRFVCFIRLFTFSNNLSWSSLVALTASTSSMSNAAALAFAFLKYSTSSVKRKPIYD